MQSLKPAILFNTMINLFISQSSPVSHLEFCIACDPAEIFPPRAGANLIGILLSCILSQYLLRLCNPSQAWDSRSNGCALMDQGMAC